jgi:hypothetical protein
VIARDGLPKETMMDPSTPFDERQLPAALDYAGFADMGQVSSVPGPKSAVMLLACWPGPDRSAGESRWRFPGSSRCICGLPT